MECLSETDVLQGGLCADDSLLGGCLRFVAHACERAIGVCECHSLSGVVRAYLSS